MRFLGRAVGDDGQHGATHGLGASRYRIVCHLLCGSGDQLEAFFFAALFDSSSRSPST